MKKLFIMCLIAIGFMFVSCTNYKEREIEIVSESIRPYYTPINYTIDSVTYYKHNGKVYEKQYKTLNCVDEDGKEIRLPYTTIKRNIWKQLYKF